MKNEQSPTRWSYRIVYRHLRLSGGTLPENRFSSCSDEIQDCAILSYDYHDSQFTGWTSRLRRARFLYRKNHVLPHQELPF